MSQNTLQLQLPVVKEWLSEETASVLRPLQDKATDLLNEVKFRIDDTTQSGQRILENSESEMNKSNPKTYRFARNANRFAQNVIGTSQTLKVPEDLNYEKFEAFCGELEKSCANLDLLRRGGYHYISPYFIFDRRRLDVSLKRLFDITKELRAFLTEKYAKAKTIEDIDSLVERLQQAIDEAKQTEEQAKQAEERRRILEKTIAEENQKMADIQAKAELNELLILNRRIQELREKVKRNLRYLQKPFLKLQNLARIGDVAIPLDEKNTLDYYLSDPFLTLAIEEYDYPSLRSVLKKLDGAIKQGKLKLKSTRLRKAQDQISSILEKDSLGQLQKDCKDALSRRKQLLESEIMSTLQDQTKQLQAKLKELQKENEFANSRSRSLENEEAKLRERVEYLKSELENSIYQVTNKSVQIVFGT